MKIWFKKIRGGRGSFGVNLNRRLAQLMYMNTWVKRGRGGGGIRAPHALSPSGAAWLATTP